MGSPAGVLKAGEMDRQQATICWLFAYGIEVSLIVSFLCRIRQPLQCCAAAVGSPIL